MRNYVRKTDKITMSREFRALPFWDRVAHQTVEQGDCHVFTGAKDQCGYGRISNGTKLVRLHREVYKREHGEIPLGMVVMHACDNRACINPAHLSVGTQSDNINDMDAKNRRVTRIGSERSTAKIDEQKALEIKKRIAAKETAPQISKDYGVSEALIYAIKQGRVWAHVGYGT